MPDLDSASLLTAELTHPGSVRTSNQDTCAQFTDPARGLRLLVVADGMGGHLGGEEASRIAVTSMGEIFDRGGDDPEQLLRQAFEHANAGVFEAATSNPELAGMGTTAVTLLFAPKARVWVAHVGDSRAYRLRQGHFKQLTRDHSVVGALLRMGHITEEEARVHPQRNEILRAIGTQEQVEMEIACLESEPGDRYLLCSDGLSGMLADPEIASVLAECEPATAVKELVRMANESGGTDNITVQIAVLAGNPKQRLPTVEIPAATDTATDIAIDTDEGNSRALLFWTLGLGVLALLGWALLGRS
jgi:serine/threonine protein phosphatase PrpC